ncbi:hypothetical protein NGR_c04710 [Sinorhizobium fredii NGR234]|uniref:Uncharacterized protein n=1 Tax=Sinorhizobium fredii (strain NBRC 101917 / NGR234) TaxID=394 RepID=C3MHD9_SINFN|nr:LysE family transporter [Sinorhizobium fredii]ACP24267.1 hypothetical protein NGR_c04710 [Sinorhizobium fredii NGR234]
MAATVIGGLYMLYLALRIATAPPVAAEQGTHLPSFLGGFVLAIANPKAYAAIGSLYVGSLVDAQQGTRAAVGSVVVLAFVAVALNTTWLAFGAAIAAVLRDPRKARIANLVFALLLLASLVPLLLS